MTETATIAEAALCGTRAFYTRHRCSDIEYLPPLSNVEKSRLAEPNPRHRQCRPHWIFDGLALLSLRWGLEDGSEILWTEHDNRTVGFVRSRVCAKERLSVFDDTPMPNPQGV